MSNAQKLPDVIDESGKKHDLKLFTRTWMDYIELSRYLFANDNAIYDVNEIHPNNKFYKPAKELAKQLGINWKNMTHEDSNRLMLALLEDTYRAMEEVSNQKNLVVAVKLKIIKPDKANE